MKSGINRILLPITVGDFAKNTAKLACGIANNTGAEVTVLIVDDESPWYETTLLPFHTKNLNPSVKHSAKPENTAINSEVEALQAIAKDMNVGLKQTIVTGHTATQILLVSRYHDIIILPEDPTFAHAYGEGPRRVKPLLEILDQTVVPVLLNGKEADTELGSAALYFDGSPYASMALHQLAYLYLNAPDSEITIRVATFEESIAKQLAKDARDFLAAKGLKNVKTEYSTEEPIDYARSHSGDSTSLAVLGIRSRQAFHDFRIGALAHHFLEAEPGKNKLFC